MAREPEHVRRRRALKSQADCSFLDGPQFARLLISGAELERCDDAAAGLRGLRDRLSGRRFFVEEECLRTGRGPEADGPRRSPLHAAPEEPTERPSRAAGQRRGGASRTSAREEEGAAGS